MRFLIIFCFLWIPLSTIVFMYLPGNSQMRRGKKKKKKKKKKNWVRKRIITMIKFFLHLFSFK
jgi:hypothetical protein